MQPNKITGASAGGPSQLPMRTRWAARVAQFWRSPQTTHMNIRHTLCFLALQLTAAPVLADTCGFTSSIPATNRLHVVDGMAAGRQWYYLLTNLKNGQQHTRPLPLIERHAHLQFFLGDDGKRFAVLDASANHRLTNRFMIYTLSGKLVAALGIQDLLTQAEQAKAGYSISHIHWLKCDPVTGSYGGYVAAEKAVSLTTGGGRKVLVSLADGKLITKKQ
jgi:hypothetical protein